MKSSYIYERRYVAKHKNRLKIMYDGDDDAERASGLFICHLNTANKNKHNINILVLCTLFQVANKCVKNKTDFVVFLLFESTNEFQYVCNRSIYKTIEISHFICSQTCWDNGRVVCVFFSRKSKIWNLISSFAVIVSIKLRGKKNKLLCTHNAWRYTQNKARR